MGERALDSNRFEIFGKIVNYFETDAVYIITVETVEPYRDRSGRTRTGVKPRINFPKIYFFKEDPHDAGKVFRDDMVSITGHVVATAKRNRFGRNYISQALIGESIVQVDLKSSEKTYIRNKVWLEGPVISVEQRGDGKVFAIKMSARNKRFDNFITVTSFDRDSLTLEQGMIIKVKARATSRVKEHDDGKKSYYQNLNVISLTKTGKVADEHKNSLDQPGLSPAGTTKPLAYGLMDDDGNIKGTDDYTFSEIDPLEIDIPKNE